MSDVHKEHDCGYIHSRRTNRNQDRNPHTCSHCEQNANPNTYGNIYPHTNNHSRRTNRNIYTHANKHLHAYANILFPHKYIDRCQPTFCSAVGFAVDQCTGNKPQAAVGLA